MDDAQERMLYEAIATTNNSLNLMANAMAEMKERLDTIEWRQEVEVTRWRTAYEGVADQALERQPHKAAATPTTFDMSVEQ